MKKIGQFLFDTWYGALAACAVSAAGVLAGVLFGFLKAVDVAGLVSAAFLLLSGLALVAAFISILVPQLITSVKSIVQYAGTFLSMNSERIKSFLLKYEFLSIEGEKLVIAWENVVSQMLNYTNLLVSNVKAGKVANLTGLEAIGAED